MKTRYELDITELDIATGVRNNSRWCMIQTAIGRLVPDASHVEVNQQTIRFSIEEDGIRLRLVYLTPPAGRKYLIDFDAKKEIKPFKCVIDNPQISETPVRKPGAVKTPSFKAQGKGSGRSSLRVFGERAFPVNQQVPTS